MSEYKYSENILLCGDWAPQTRQVQSSLNGLMLINIEGPIFKDNKTSLKPSRKVGPHINNYIHPNSIFKCISILSNNHLFDYGVEGYNKTIRSIKEKNGISVGAGYTLEQAKRPLFFEWKNKRVALLARCENQFGGAQIKSPGVATLDSTIFSDIRTSKSKSDFVIVSIHAASEMLPWPSPQRRDMWRALIDAGADIVHGHHSHVPQGWEKYKNGYIFYGLGNFCVDPTSWSCHQNSLWSLNPEIDLVNEELEIKIKTSVIEDKKQNIHIRSSTQSEKLSHLNYLQACNDPLKDPVLLEGLWRKHQYVCFSNIIKLGLIFA